MIAHLRSLAWIATNVGWREAIACGFGALVSALSERLRPVRS